MPSFEVLAWTESGSFVLYVPALEALTRAAHLDDIEPAARDLITDLSGLDGGSVRLTVRFRRPGPHP